MVPLIATVACVAESSTADGPVARDSAGITVITYGAGDTGRDGPDRTLTSVPLFSIGGDSLPLHRVMGPLLQSNGGIVVGSAAQQSVLFFDAEGDLLRRVGGPGEGPGEFSQLTLLTLGPGDSVWAYDSRQRRVTVLAPGGDLSRTASIAAPEEAVGVQYLAALADGRMMVAFHRRTPGTGLSRDSLTIALLPPDGGAGRPVATFPHVFVHWGPHVLPGSGEGMRIPLPVPLSSQTAVAGNGESVYVATADRFVLTLLTPEGIRRITRRTDAPRRITDEDRETFFASLGGAGMRGPEAELLRRLRGPETLPVFGSEPLTSAVGRADMIVTAGGGVWLQPFVLGNSPDTAWRVYDAAGFYAGRIVFPTRYRPTAARGDLVIGVYQDSADVEFVRAYRLGGTP